MLNFERFVTLILWIRSFSLSEHDCLYIKCNSYFCCQHLFPVPICAK